MDIGEKIEGLINTRFARLLVHHFAKMESKIIALSDIIYTPLASKLWVDKTLATKVANFRKVVELDPVQWAHLITTRLIARGFAQGKIFCLTNFLPLEVNRPPYLTRVYWTKETGKSALGITSWQDKPNWVIPIENEDNICDAIKIECMPEMCFRGMSIKIAMMYGKYTEENFSTEPLSLLVGNPNKDGVADPNPMWIESIKNMTDLKLLDVISMIELGTGLDFWGLENYIEAIKNIKH